MKSVYQDVERCCVKAPEAAGETRTASFVFPKNFAGFDGHFPDAPIVPGIAQVYAAQITAGGRLLAHMKRCKFTRPVGPDETVDVVLTMGQGDNAAQCKAALSVKGETCASMALVFAETENAQ